MFAITSDAAGSFKLPVLILVNTLLGPRIVSAVAQPGVFEQVDTDLLIVAGTIQPQGTGGFVQLVTNHVLAGRREPRRVRRTARLTSRWNPANEALAPHCPVPGPGTVQITSRSTVAPAPNWYGETKWKSRSR